MRLETMTQNLLEIKIYQFYSRGRKKAPLRQDGFGLIIARLFNAVKRRFLLRFSRFFPSFHQYTRQNVFCFFEFTKF